MRMPVSPGGVAGVFLALALLSPATAHGQRESTIEIEFTNANLVPPHWVMKIHPDGSGEYDSEKGQPAPSQTSQLTVGSIHRTIQLSADFAERVFATARARKLFEFPCESHLKVAFQGLKKLSYSGPDGSGSCEFNYSKDKEIQALGDSLVGVAGTILEGARLEMLLVHDRLGLDREMEYLLEASQDGRIQQVCAIRDILERLAEDEGVMERVRKRARILLAKTER